MSVSSLSQKSVMVIFTYSPAGLGHLRVTDALFHGLPKGITPVILGSQDSFIRFAHRFTSIHPFARSLLEWLQQGPAELLFTRMYRSFLKTHATTIYRQMKTVMSQRIEVPQTVFVVATHFGMAHQLAAIKGKLQKDLDVRIILIVQVTDDSPQRIWYVPGANMIVVPSEHTKLELIQYGKAEGLEPVDFEVNPYPVSPVLSEPLTSTLFESRVHQLHTESTSHIHVSIPISGAAVGTDYLSTLVETLHAHSNRFLFHIIAKTAPFTFTFLSHITNHSYVKVLTSTHDRVLVDYYEQIYQQQIISLEVTKPSEQAFKTLLEPRQRGGVVMLFSNPVGRQEYDNLNFMKRHHMIPSLVTHHNLYHAAENNLPLSGELKDHVERHAPLWRGLILPIEAIKSAEFIFWCHREGVFKTMMEYDKHAYMSKYLYNPQELGSDGVISFWQKVSRLI